MQSNDNAYLINSHLVYSLAIVGKPSMLLVAYPSEKATRKDEVAWIIDRTRRNTSNGTQTCIISAYHTILKKDLSDLLANRLVLYAEIVHGVISRSYEERTFEISDQLLDIGIFLSQLIENAKKIRIPLDIIFHNFSALIHNLGDEEVYRFITYKTQELDEKTDMVLFVYPKSHIERIWEKFKNQAYEVVEIRSDRM